jgi:endonuclease-3
VNGPTALAVGVAFLLGALPFGLWVGRLARGVDVRQVEDGLLKAVPPEYRQDAHHWLILHGRYVCKARKPDCPQCVIRDLCRYDSKTPG